MVSMEKPAGYHVEDLTMVETKRSADVDIEEVENLRRAQDNLFSEGRPKWEVVKENKRCMFIILILLIGMIVGGTDGTVSNALVGSQSFCKLMGAGYKASSGKYAVTPETATIWSAVNTPFQVFSVPAAGLVIDRIGRRWTMWVGLIILTAAGAAQLGAKDWKTFCLVKVLYGAAGGFTQVSSITLVSEIAPRELRGLLMAIVPLMTTTGIWLAAFITYYSNLKHPSADSKLGYQIPEIVVLVLPIIILVLQYIFLVETPYFLLLKGKSQQTQKAMRKIYPGRTEEQYGVLFAEYEYILFKESERKELEAGSSFLDCLRGVNLRRTFVALLPQMSQSFCGQSLVGTQATYFFTLAGQKNSLQSSTISHCIGILGYLVASGLLEVKFLGRFRMLVIGQVFMITGMLSLGAITTKFVTPYSVSVADAILFCVCITVFGSALGPGAAGWAYIGESSSARLRGKTAMFGVLGNSLIGASLSTAVPYMLVNPPTGFGVHGIGYFFGAFGVAMVVITIIWIPDFTGLSYAQIDELFQKKVSSRRFHSAETTGDYGRDILVEDHGVKQALH